MKKIILLIGCLSPFVVAAQLKINEIMPKNVSSKMDDAYNYSMWVEIYNASETISYDLSNYYFTDDITQPKKWRPSSKILAPKTYALFWFEREDRAGHASFKLEPEGGKLYLLGSLSQVIDNVTYPQQYRNISYGRKTDGGTEWVFFEQSSPGTSNDGKVSSAQRCANPVFATKGGFYTSSVRVEFNTPAMGDTIYYTTNGAEPTRQSTRYIPGAFVSLSSTAAVRAKCYSAQKLSSEIVTNTYFINARDFKLPVVSIVTEQANLTDNTIGIYVQGTNGITGNGMNTPANWNQDWDRPANFELYDTTKVGRLNQELDIRIAGGWTRMNGQKSLVINPKNKFGNNKLDYDIFAATKPGLKYRSILLRNSGNDFACSMMRDAYMTSLIVKRMDLDYMAYEPAVCYMNGVYYGIQNLRERSNEDLIYSNYGLKEEEVYLKEAIELPTDTAYLRLVNYISSNNMSLQSVYDNVCKMMDVDNFANYMLTQIYYANTDWPHNNLKAWKAVNNGRWRWILQDTDFGYGLDATDNYNHNTLSYILDFNDNGITKENVSRKIMKGLMQNDSFKNKFIDRFCVQISSTFEKGRADRILDSLAAKISTEIVYHKNKWGSSRSFTSDIEIMKTFSDRRPGNMLGFLSSRFFNSASIRTISITSDNPKASYTFNAEKIIDPSVNLKYFNGRSVTLTADTVFGYTFKQWELVKSAGTETLIPYGSIWKYFDGSAVPATNWSSADYNDTSWKSGQAQLGYGGKGEVTTIGYGGNASNKYTTSYYRKSVSISNLADKSNFAITIFVDDGAAVYVNGTEVGRTNMPSGTLVFSTFASVYNNGIYATFNVPKDLLKEGANVIAAEVHQCDLVSSDVIFNLEMTYELPTGAAQVVTDRVYSTTLSSNTQLKAVYEPLFEEDPDKDLKVVINELVASNTKVKDEYGEFDDYIELYNAGDTDVNIAGWYLTDKPADKLLCQIPTTDSALTILPAGERIIIWADGQPEQGVLHVGFSLSKDGETVVLSKYNYLGELVILDQVSFPALQADYSYARVPDGSDNWEIQPATFNKPNELLSSVPDAQKILTCVVYPTQVYDHFMVENAGGKPVQVVDLLGKVLIRKNISSDLETVNVKSLNPGIYLVVVGDKIFKITK